MRLTDYKVRVLDSYKGTAAKVRVLIEWSDHRTSWSTVGVSDNVIEASWRALVDAIRLELMRIADEQPKRRPPHEATARYVAPSAARASLRTDVVQISASTDRTVPPARG